MTGDVHLLWDTVRFVACVMFAANIGAMVAVSRLYRARAEAKQGIAAVLPEHVWRVAAAQLVFLIIGLGLTIEKLGGAPVWYGLPLVLVGNTLLLLGLRKMIRYQRLKHAQAAQFGGQRADDPPDTRDPEKWS